MGWYYGGGKVTGSPDALTKTELSLHFSYTMLASKITLALSIGKVMFKKLHNVLTEPAMSAKRMMMVFAFMLVAPCSNLREYGGYQFHSTN
ncbi:MAG: hypothetical protein ACJAX5_002743 [Patiriisocius sp.]|jgi:hypothetical protein